MVVRTPRSLSAAATPGSSPSRSGAAWVKASDVAALNVHTATLTHLVRSSVLEHVAPGRYCLTNPDGVTENHSLVVVVGTVPAGLYAY